MATQQSAQKRLQKELLNLQKTPALDGSAVEILDENVYKWRCSIQGPKKTPYEGGVFKFEFNFPKEYPFHPPVVKCETKTYHINFDEQGNICLEILRKDGWSPMVGVKEVLIAIEQLLNEPNASHPLDEKLGELYNTNKSQFEKTAKEWTKKYAK